MLVQRAVSEDPRWTRAAEDQSASIPEEITGERGGIICNLARRPQWDQHGCHSKREKVSELGWNIIVVIRRAQSRISRASTLEAEQQTMLEAKKQELLAKLHAYKDDLKAKRRVVQAKADTLEQDLREGLDQM